MRDKVSGIYKIISPSNKIYIGSSINIYARHCKYKNNHCENQPKLYNSYKKYGFKNHIFEIIEECEFEQLYIRERYWQEFYNSVENGLNCVYVRTDLLPQKLSEETKLKISLSNKGISRNKGIKFSEETKKKILDNKIKNNKTKKVYQFDLDGNLLDEFETIVIAAKKTNNNTSNIYLCLKNPQYTSKGYSWSYDKNYNIVKKKFRNSHKCVQINCLNLEKNIIKTFESIKEASLIMNVPATSISKCCTGKLKTAYGYFWEYARN